MNGISMNMTEGGIVKKLILFAIPVLVANIFQQLYNVADTAIIGNILGDRALAAVGAAAPVYALLIGVAGGLTNGFAVIISRYFGAKDEKHLDRSVTLTYMLSGIIAAIVTIISVIAVHPLLVALLTPPEIIEDTERYLRIILMFSFIMVAYNMYAGMLLAIGNSVIPLVFLVASTFLNIGLDYFFVKNLGMGVAGAATATVISQGAAVFSCYLYALKKCRTIVFKKSAFVWDKSMLKDLITTGTSMCLMFSIVAVGSVILQGAVNAIDTQTITAHTAARKIDDIFTLPLSTISVAASTFASQNYGAAKMDRVKKGIRYSIYMTTIWSAVSMLIIVLFRTAMVKALTGTTDQKVLDTASMYMIWNAAFFSVLGALLVLRASLQSVGRKVVPVIASIIELVFKVVAAAFITRVLGYFGICILEPVIWIICTVIVAIDYVLFLKKVNEPGYNEQL